MPAPLAFIRPLVPSSAARLPTGHHWLHEPKWDGFRFQIIKDGSDVRLYSKSGAEYSDRLPSMVEAFAKLPTQTAILDGELCLIDPTGGAHFYRLMHQMRTKQPDESQLMFLAFDLLHQDGVDLRGLPLSERKRDLTRLCRRSVALAFPQTGRDIPRRRSAVRPLQPFRLRRRRKQAPILTLRERSKPQLGQDQVPRLEAYQRGAAQALRGSAQARAYGSPEGTRLS